MALTISYHHSFPRSERLHTWHSCTALNVYSPPLLILLLRLFPSINAHAEGNGAVRSVGVRAEIEGSRKVTRTGSHIQQGLRACQVPPWAGPAGSAHP